MKERVSLYLKDVVFSLMMFFLVVIVVNIFLFPDMPGFVGLNPHPYLLVILLMAGRYGTREGVIAAVLASALLAVYAALESRPFFSVAELTQRPLVLSFASFFISALVVGEMRGFNKRYERALLHENHELKQRNRRLEDQLEIVTEIKEELENRIIGQEHSVHSLYQATKALETLDEDEFYQALTELTARFSGATQVSLFMVDYSTETLRRVAQYGPNPAVDEDETYPMNEGVFETVLRHNRLLTIKEISDDPNLLQVWERSHHRAYVYVPLTMATVTVGILTVDDIPFLKLNISTIRMLALISELAVPGLKNIIEYQDLQEMVRTDPITGFLKYQSFLAMAEIEFKRAVRYNQSLSLIWIEVEGIQEIGSTYGHHARIEALKYISQSLSQKVRSVDLIGCGPKEGHFLIAMPMSRVEAALAVIDRIERLCQAVDGASDWKRRLRCFCGEASYHPSLRSFSQMLKLAERSLKLKKAAHSAQSKGSTNPKE